MPRRLTTDLGDDGLIRRRPATGRLGDKRLTRRRPATGRLGDDRLIRRRPATGRLGDDGPIRRRPATGRLGDKRLTKRRPATGRLGDKRMTTRRPATGRLGDRRRTKRRPVTGRLGDTPPISKRPATGRLGGAEVHAGALPRAGSEKKSRERSVRKLSGEPGRRGSEHPTSLISGNKKHAFRLRPLVVVPCDCHLTGLSMRWWSWMAVGGVAPPALILTIVAPLRK